MGFKTPSQSQLFYDSVFFCCFQLHSKLFLKEDYYTWKLIHFFPAVPAHLIEIIIVLYRSSFFFIHLNHAYKSINANYSFHAFVWWNSEQMQPQSKWRKAQISFQAPINSQRSPVGLCHVLWAWQTLRGLQCYFCRDSQTQCSQQVPRTAWRPWGSLSSLCYSCYHCYLFSIKEIN